MRILRSLFLQATCGPMSQIERVNPLTFCVVSLLCALPAVAADYYVSNSGDDENSGTAPADAWQSIARVNSFTIAPGDVIHFKCGGEWRRQLVPSSGSSQGHVTYTSYGDGPKPLLLGSVEMNDSADWQPVGTNLWETRPLPVDVGNIIFNNGQSCGIKMWEREDVDARNKFCYDRQQKTVLLYATQNPGTQFDDIECALKRHIINQGDRSYVIYDGLHLAYGGAHGIGGGGTHRITVRNCDLCFIGGGHQHSRKTKRGEWHVRYGNGVEFWAGAHDNLVEHCRIWDIYDAGLTNQGSGKNAQYNITYRNNLVWNCEYSFEYWNRPAESVTYDIYFEDNLCFNAGQGWSHAQRPWPAGVHLMFFSNSAKTDKFFIRRNVFHNAETAFLSIDAANWNGVDGLVLTGNIHYQKPDKTLVRWGGKSYLPSDFDTYKSDTGKDTDSRLVELTSILVNPNPIELAVNGTQQIKATGVYSQETNIHVTQFASFVSSDDTIVSVDSAGVVKALRPGKALVCVQFEGFTASASVVVRR